MIFCHGNVRIIVSKKAKQNKSMLIHKADWWLPEAGSGGGGGAVREMGEKIQKVKQNKTKMPGIV